MHTDRLSLVWFNHTIIIVCNFHTVKRCFILSNHFSERVLLLRKANNLSQAALGDAIGLSKQTINDIEKGRSKTTLDKAKLLADYFDVSLDYLTGRTDEPVNPNVNK